MLSDSDEKDLERALESKGETQSRHDLKMGMYSEHRKKFVEHWLEMKERVSKAKKDQDILNVNKSLRNSSWAAAITSLIAAIISIVIAYYH